MNIELHIERLILDGLPVEMRERAFIQSALEAELARLLAENGLAPMLMEGGALPQLSAGSVQLTNDMTPPGLGQQIAGAVYAGIGNESPK
jgi:hypothetical protein